LEAYNNNALSYTFPVPRLSSTKENRLFVHGLELGPLPGVSAGYIRGVYVVLFIEVCFDELREALFDERGLRNS